MADLTDGVVRSERLEDRNFRGGEYSRETFVGHVVPWNEYASIAQKHTCMCRRLLKGLMAQKV